MNISGLGSDEPLRLTLYLLRLLIGSSLSTDSTEPSSDRPDSISAPSISTYILLNPGVNRIWLVAKSRESARLGKRL